ncbi:uncharacterized protein METZ01_LOCUS166379, partial [marine metagenome]
MDLKAKSILLPIFAGIIIFIWMTAGFFYHQATVSVGENTQTIILSIPPGATLKKISTDLKGLSLIRNASAFRLLANIRQKQTHIQVGEYELNQSMLPMDILKAITSGKTVLHPITIPEGYRISEIAELLTKKISINKEIFIKESRNKDLLNKLNITSKSLEGYLFPETYHFSKHTAEKKIIQTMLSTFQQQMKTKNIQDQIQSSDMSLHEIITLASLIEKETGMNGERKHISSVFHNRLKRKMRLQTDPTVIYAIENFDGNIRKKDLAIDSPYNTYRYKGLPPGPI